MIWNPDIVDGGFTIYTRVYAIYSHFVDLKLRIREFAQGQEADLYPGLAILTVFAIFSRYVNL